MKAVVDTNVIVGAVVEDTDIHEEAAGILEGLDEAVVPLIVLYELAWVFRKLGIPARHLASVYESLLSNPRVRIVAEKPADLYAASRYISSRGLSLRRFNDEVILRTAARLGLPLVTFDKELARRAAELGVTVIGHRP